jgi:LmbE family N-acetylglucosaminyl deacetylase
MAELEAFPEDWQRGLAIVAHPDDMEYGAAAAVARWTGQGKWVGYVLVSDGEAGIATMPPDVAGPIRRDEQRASCAVVGVTDVEFLGRPDGGIVEGLDLRADLTAAIRRHRPDVVLSINHRDDWDGAGWNHADHRAVGRALLDAVRDAANPWLFPDAGAAWAGVRFAAFGGSPRPTHGVDVTATFDVGVRSLECHRVYLANLGGEMAAPASFLRAHAEQSGPRMGAVLATTFEIVS